MLNMQAPVSFPKILGNISTQNIHQVFALQAMTAHWKGKLMTKNSESLCNYSIYTRDYHESILDYFRSRKKEFCWMGHQLVCSFVVMLNER